MNKIGAWLASYNITTHSVVLLMAFLIAGFDAVPAFHDWAIQIYKTLPSWLEQTILAAFGLYAWYRKGQPQQSSSVDGANSLHLNS